MTVPIQLSTVKPDFPSLVLQLQLYLQSKGTWVDLQTSGTGQTLVEMAAAVGTFNQFGIESAVRELYLTTARRASSIYAITRMLGVRISRKTPAGVDVTLSRNSTLSSELISKFTQFTVNGVKFFNRVPLMFAAGSSTASERLYFGTVTSVDARTLKIPTASLSNLVLEDGDEFYVLVNSGSGSGQYKRVVFRAGLNQDFTLADSTETAWSGIGSTSRISLLSTGVRLYAGTIQTEEFISDASSFKQIYLSKNAFAISDLDVEVTVTNPSTNVSEIWSKTSDGLWVAESGAKVYYDSTSGLGETIIAFGDNLHGSIPVLGSTISVKYATTDGATDNSGTSGLAVACPSNSSYSGVTTSSINGGADEKDAEFYRYFAPKIHKARGRMVTADDYQALASDYPGIISVNVQGQRDIAPTDLRWMNVVQLCLLPLDTNQTTLTSSQWKDFLTYVSNIKHAAVQILKKDAVAKQVKVDVTLVLKATYTPSACIPTAESNITSLFTRRIDTLGRRYALSDISEAAKVEGVDYVEINACCLVGSTGADALIPEDATHFYELADLTVNTRYSERQIYSDGSS